jgi:hypothetical protein
MIAPQAFRQGFRDVRVIFGFSGGVPAGLPSLIVQLEIAAFDLNMGIFRWSRHDAVVRLKMSALNAQGSPIWTAEVSGQGNSSGATQGIAYVPIAGNRPFDQALGVRSSLMFSPARAAPGEAR